ncbi:MAG TPA: DUF3500 domain-containing protein [Vicinamibacterales bacterium]|nr:DUF3500 domain-containing protein [Vicinamibacterales bacterium]
MTRHLAPACVIATLILAAPVALNSAPTATGRAMADAANALLSDLNAEQRSKASYKFEDDTRFEFRYTPRARTGLPLEEMTDAQRTKAHGLLKTGLSMRGYTNATDIIALENVLRAIEPPRTGPNAIVRDPELYFVSIYGDPAGNAPWGWKFEGHHISVNFTLVDGRPVVFAPSFFGSNPATVREGPQAGKRALRDEEASGRALMAAFTDEQKKKVMFADTAPRDMITSENREAKVLEPVGVTYAEMTPEQRRLLERVLDAYLGRVAPELAESRLAEVRKAGMDKILFGWAGTLDVGGPHYYRVQGPTFLIEYDNVQNNANHIHSVWRDFNGDFGRDILREHYKTFAH